MASVDCWYSHWLSGHNTLKMLPLCYPREHRPVAKLTVASVAKIKPDATKRLEIPDSLLPGLYYVLQPSGARSWCVRYRFAGVSRKLTLRGVPPDGLAKAHQMAREALEAIADGRDPAAEKCQTALNC